MIICSSLIGSFLAGCCCIFFPPATCMGSQLEQRHLLHLPLNTPSGFWKRYLFSYSNRKLFNCHMYLSRKLSYSIGSTKLPFVHCALNDTKARATVADQCSVLAHDLIPNMQGSDDEGQATSHSGKKKVMKTKRSK